MRGPTPNVKNLRSDLELHCAAPTANELDHAILFRNANSGHLALCSNRHPIMVCVTILGIVDRAVVDS